MFWITRSTGRLDIVVLLSSTIRLVSEYVLADATSVIILKSHTAFMGTLSGYLHKGGSNSLVGTRTSTRPSAAVMIGSKMWHDGTSQVIRRWEKPQECVV